MNDQIYHYVRKHTSMVTTLIILGFLLLGLGEYKLYRKQMQLSKMVSEGLMQIKEGQDGTILPSVQPPLLPTQE